MVRDRIQLMDFYFGTQMYETSQYYRLSERESELLSGKFQIDDPSIEIICHVMLL